MNWVLAFSFPNPFSLFGSMVGGVIDLVVDVGSDVAESIVGEVIGGLAGATIGALLDMVASILGFFWEASEPTLGDRWFSGEDAPYSRMVALSMPLLLAFICAGVIQGVLKGDTGGMIRMIAARLPGAVLAMSISIAVADLLIQITDDMSRAMLGDFRQDIEQVGTVMRSMMTVPGASLAMLLLMLVFAFIGLMAAVVLVVQLFARGSLIYLVAAFSPLIFAASVWEPMRGAVRKLGEVAFALIVSKLAIAIALAVSSAALVGSWPQEEPTEVPTPELMAAQIERSHTQSLGILLSSVVMFAVAAFMPWVVFRLMPMAEGALVSQGIGPLRALHSANASWNSIMYNPATSAVRNAFQKRNSSKKSDSGSGSGTSGGPSERPGRSNSDAALHKPYSQVKEKGGGRRQEKPRAGSDPSAAPSESSPKGQQRGAKKPPSGGEKGGSSMGSSGSADSAKKPSGGGKGAPPMRSGRGSRGSSAPTGAGKSVPSTGGGATPKGSSSPRSGPRPGPSQGAGASSGPGGGGRGAPPIRQAPTGSGGKGPGGASSPPSLKQPPSSGRGRKGGRRS